MAREQGKVGEAKSDVIGALPRACMDESAAVEFIEKQRWGDEPYCPHCGVVGNSYKMKDAKTGGRNSRYLWRCHDCKKQFTVRTGAIFEDSRIPLKHWCFGFWAACSSKKGVSAKQIQRQTGVSYKSALFMMHQIRLAMAEPMPPKLSGDVEVDETFVGGKPRGHLEIDHRVDWKWRKRKSIVLGMVKRGGSVRARVIANITAKNLRQKISEHIDLRKSRLLTDQRKAYRRIGMEFGLGHEAVDHSIAEYVRGEASVNTAESFFALIKRGVYGTFHNVSKHHLHRYLSEFEFRWNTRKLDDGARVALAIKGASGKRLMYRDPVRKN